MGTLVFLHIRRLGLFFLVQILNFNMFGGFQKNEYFWGYEDFVDIFWGSSQNCASLRVISMQFRIFFRSRYRIGIFFWVAKISNIFLGYLIFQIFFGVNGRCWVRAYVCGKN